MLKRFKIFLLSALLLLLITSFYVASSIQLIPPAVANNNLKSCYATQLMGQPPADTDGLNPQHISFLNWNIYKQSEDGWHQDLSAFVEQHDVLTLQEARLNTPLISLLQQNKLNWTINSTFTLDGEATGVMTAANKNALRSCGFKVKEPLIQLPKAALISYYTLQGSDKTLLVANIHSINFSLGLQAYHQQLENLYQAVHQHQGPMIIAGDFNSWSDERMNEVMSLVNKLSLSRLEYSVDNKTHLFGNAIDHVFFRQLEPISKKVLQVTSSDHNPISVNFRVKL